MRTVCYFGLIVASIVLAERLPAQLAPLRVTSLPVGDSPSDVILVSTTINALPFGLVAFPAGNKVAVYAMGPDSSGQWSVSPWGISYSLPSPTGFSSCASDLVLVISPSDGSVSFIGVSSVDNRPGAAYAPIKIVPGLYSATCWQTVTASGSAKMTLAASTTDDHLVLFDVQPLGNGGPSLAQLASISNVRGRGGLQGFALLDANTLLVAGDNNVTSVVDLKTNSVKAKLPLSGPMAKPIGVDGQLLIGDQIHQSIYLIDSNLNIVSTVGNIPSPQAVLDAGTGMGQFVATGLGNSVIQFSTTSPSTQTVLSNIPGSFAMGLTSTTRIWNPVILVTSPTSNSIFIIQRQAAQPSALSVSNGASFAAQINAPGSLASLFANSGVTGSSSASGVPLPSSLAGVSLRVGGTFNYDNASGTWIYSSQGSTVAGLLYVDQKQINFQVPPGAPVGDSVPVQLLGPGNTTLNGTMKVVATAPGIFTLNSSGSGQAAALNQDNTVNFGTNPAARGTVIQVFATGAGATNPTLATGVPAAANGNPLVYTVAQPTVSIGGVNAPVQFSGMAPGFVGVWQINAIVPQTVTPGNAVSMSVTAGGVMSNTVTIAVK